MWGLGVGAVEHAPLLFVLIVIIPFLIEGILHK